MPGASGEYVDEDAVGGAYCAAEDDGRQLTGSWVSPAVQRDRPRWGSAMPER